jgi:two-component system, LytTR family, response regulator
MIKALIIEDEPKNVRILRALLEENCPQVQVIGEAHDVEGGYASICELKPQVVFLDIEMPQGNAFDLLDKFTQIDFELIFVTAFDEYALRALKYSALDYLLKPVNVDELVTAVNRAARMLDMKNIQQRIGVLLSNLKQKEPDMKKMAINSAEGMFFVEVEQIVRCEAKGSYTEIYMLGGEKHLVSKGIQEYEKLLPETHFFRIHHSHIINLNLIRKYQKGRGGFVVMQDGTTVEVASRRKDAFLARFTQ